MTSRRPPVWRIGLVAAVVILLLTPLRASDHADPIDLFNRKPLEGGITDLFFFPRTDDKGVKRMEVILCVRRALTEAGSLMLEPYTYTIYMDLHSAVTFDKTTLKTEEELKRYGGSIGRPEGIAPTVTIPIRLTNKGEFKEPRTFPGLLGDPARITIKSGVFDDPFIFPTFFGTNVVGIVLSIPLDAFPPQQHDWLIWATSTRDGKPVDHVGRSLRTQNPRFDMLNTLPPSQHVAAIKAERAQPSLMRDILLRFNFQQVFAFRDWDEVPDVMIYTDRSPVGFPNGRLLTDDVAELLAKYGDTLLKEISYITGRWAFDDAKHKEGRATANDMDFRLVEPRCARPDPNNALTDADRTAKCDQTRPENLAFPYLADPWPEKKPKPPPMLSDATKMKLWLAGLALVALFILENWIVAKWYYRKQLRRRFL